jgi:hypothetical protein
MLDHDFKITVLRTDGDFSPYHHHERYDHNQAYDNGTYVTDFHNGHGINRYNNQFHVYLGEHYVVAVENVGRGEFTLLQGSCQCGWHTSYGFTSWLYTPQSYQCLLYSHPGNADQRVVNKTRAFIKSSYQD